jgi:RIO kinase 1
MGTVHREEYKTLKNVFDLFTEKNLFKLISQGYIDGLHSPLSTGKEANIFTAKKGDEIRIVKIYRLQTCDFNRMYDYIKTDPRYVSLKNRRRDVIFAWAHRENRNLLKAREVEVRVPTPYTVLHNILIMEFIGDDEGAAPKLKDKKPENIEEFFKEVIEQMRKLYKTGLIHADLSGFNILNFNEKPVFIDMSQATTLDNPHAREYLKRDVHNICVLFKKWGVKADEEKVLKKITLK